MNDLARIITADAKEGLANMADGVARTIITSPPYWGLRDYGVDGQLGLENSIDEYLHRLLGIFAEAWRVLADDGTLWLNLGDGYAMRRGNAGATAGRFKPKDLIGIPWTVAFALRDAGWYLRSDIIWAKPNPMPESVTDRPTKAHEYLFLLSKSERYHYDAEAVKEPSADPQGSAARYTSAFGGEKARAPVGAAGIDTRTRPLGMRQFDGRRNKRTVWTVTTQPFSEAHVVTFPPKLIRPCVLAGSEPGDTVLDPFAGSGTTGVVALQHGRRFLGIELNPEYVAMAEKRLEPLLAQPRLLEPAC